VLISEVVSRNDNVKFSLRYPALRTQLTRIVDAFNYTEQRFFLLGTVLLLRK